MLSRGRHHRHTFSYFVLNYKKDLPLPRFELTTFRVTTRRSITEILWLLIFGLLYYCTCRWFGGTPKWRNTKIKRPLLVNKVTDELYMQNNNNNLTVQHITNESMAKNSILHSYIDTMRKPQHNSTLNTIQQQQQQQNAIYHHSFQCTRQKVIIWYTH